MQKININGIVNTKTALVSGAVGSAILLTLLAVNNHKPQLTKLADQYAKNKKKGNNPKAKQKNKEIIQKAVKIISNIPEKANTLASASKDVLNNTKSGIARTQIYESLKDKVLNFPFEINNNDSFSISVVNVPNSNDSNDLNNTINLLESIMTPIFKKTKTISDSFFSTPALEMVPVGKTHTVSNNNPANENESNFYRAAICTTAAIILLNSLRYSSITQDFVDYSQTLISETKDDLEEYLTDTINDIGLFLDNTMEYANVYFTDTMDVVLTLNDHDSLVERKVDRIATSDASGKEKIAEIFSLKDLYLNEKILSIIELDDVDYIDKFDFFTKSGNFTMEEAMNIICNSGIATYTNIFDYIMNIESLSITNKINYILYSDITDYKNVFDFIMNISSISIDERIDYIINSVLTNYIEKFDYLISNNKIDHDHQIEVIAKSNIATYEEKFDYFVNLESSTYEKVWSTLQIPNVSFNKVFNDLLNLKGISKEELIPNVMKTDLVSFKNIFDAILKIDNIDAEQVSNYLIYYSTFINKSTNYNAISLDEILNYALNLKILSHEDKVNLFWDSLDGLSLNEKSDFILKHYSMTFEEFISLMTEKQKELTEEQSIVIDLFNKIYAIKEEYILSHYGFETLEQLKKLVAGCAAEAAFSYIDIYAVINTIFNRYTEPWYAKKGHNIYNQFIARGQFAVYKSETEGAYLIYLNHTGYRSEEKYKLAQIAVYDMLYDGYDGIIHNYIEFRWSGAEKFSSNQFVEGGNRYKYELADEKRIVYEFLIHEDDSEELETQNESVKVIIYENQKTKQLSARAQVLKRVS